LRRNEPATGHHDERNGDIGYIIGQESACGDLEAARFAVSHRNAIRSHTEDGDDLERG